MNRIIFRPEVADDVLTAYTWYEKKYKGLGEDFLRVFYAHIDEIARNPLQYRKIYGDFRRCLMRRFPFAVFLLVEEEAVVVLGVFHCARNPDWIHQSLDDR